jgi:hypothetical protein
MSTLELQKRLIDKIQKTSSSDLLEEAYRLLELESDDSPVYTLNKDQKNSVQEARLQISNGKGIGDAEANNEIDQWLNK